MFRKILFGWFVVCFFLTIQTFAQTKNFTAGEIAGTYSISGVWDSQDITLNEDGSYAVIRTSDWCEVNPEEASDCLNYYRESGSFSLAGNIVRFNIAQYRRFDPEGKSKDDPPPNYELVIIKWSERIYLIKKDSLKQFADAVNMKVEPRKTTLSFSYNYFYPRRENIENPVSGPPELPGGWNDFLLKKPVKAVVLKIKTQNGERIAVIDKGSRAGLKIGMQMVTDFFPNGSEVISVNKSSALVKLKNDLKKGDQIRSYYDPENWFLDLGFVN
jgi:hypothetical protein